MSPRNKRRIRRWQARNAGNDHVPRITAAVDDGIMQPVREPSVVLRVRSKPSGDVDEGFVDVELIEALRTPEPDDERHIFLRPDVMMRTMMSAIKTPTQLDVVRYTFGLDGYPALTLDQIASRMGFRNRMEVRSIYYEALDEMQRLYYLSEAPVNERKYRRTFWGRVQDYR